MKKIINLFLFIVTSITVSAFNFSVAPTKFELDLKKINTNEIVLINNTSSPMRLESYLETPKGYEKYNLNDKIKLYPKMIAIKPGGKQIVRFRVKTKEIVSDGEYKSYIVFKEIPIKKGGNRKKINDLDIKIKMITEVGISVYGYQGNIVKDISITEVNVDFNRKNETLVSKVKAVSKGNSSDEIIEKIELINSNEKIIDSKIIKIGRTLRTGEVELENKIEIKEKEAKKARITIIDSRGEEYRKKEITL